MQRNVVIKRSLKINGNIAPESYDILCNLPKESLNYNKFIERHPLGIYNYSLGRILKSFSYLIDQIGMIEQEQPDVKSFNDRSIEILLIFQTELLHSLHAHIDDCFRILKITSSPSNKEMEKNLSSRKKNEVERSVSKWLEHFDHPSYKNFEEKISNYRKHVGKIVNKIKHNHARLRLITMNMEGFDVFGYYVEGIELNENKKIVACPDPEIHPNYTAFSLNRDIRYHFYNIYEISHFLKEALILALKEDYNFQIDESDIYTDYDTDFENIANKIQNLDLAFFHDEYKKLLPQISINKKNNDTTLTLKLIKNQISPTITQKINVNFFQEMDSVTEKIKRPYIEYFAENMSIDEVEFF